MKSQKKIAVILAGCGRADGAEIHEATLTLYAIVKNGASYETFAPDINQHHVINHITGEEMKENRNVLIESARITRGKIKPMKEFKAAEFDALILPGGYGVAKNLCTFAFDGPDCRVNEQVAAAIKSMAALGKPIGALCIAPALIAKVLGDVEVTIGQDTGTAQAITKMGGKHKNTGHGEIAVDTKRKVVTTPCYMLDSTIVQIADGVDKVVKAVIELM